MSENTYTSTTHRATLQSGLLAVHSHTGPVVVERTFDGADWTERTVTADDDGAAAGLAKAMASMPVFAATAAEGDPGWYHCDIDAGFQRWHGSKPEAELRAALTNCDFADDEIEAILASCQDAPWSHCPRQG